MNKTRILTASILALSLGATGTVLAKAHDQGVADGSDNPDNTGQLLQTLPNGVSTLVKDGAQGAGASSAQGDNQVEPVVNGEPD